MKVLDANNNYNFPHYYSSNSTQLIHFYGALKPWSNNTAQNLFPEWVKYYKKFISITGLASSAVREYPNIGEAMRRDLAMQIYGNLLYRFAFDRNLKIYINPYCPLLTLIFNNFSILLSVLIF